jgi:predicted dienelactone hydrolase
MQLPLTSPTVFVSSAMGRRCWLKASSGLGLGLAAACFTPRIGAQTVPNLQDEVWTDASRSRAVPALLRWPDGVDPAAGNAAGKVQGAVIFSHGMGGRRTGADVWGKAWAQAGMLVVHLQHPGSDNEALRGGFSALAKANSPEQLLVRVADVKFVIDEMQRKVAAKQSLWADVPLQRLAVAGHSYGARTVQALAGQNYPKANGWSGLDKRIKAFVAMSPALGKGTSAAQARLDAKAMTRPMLVVSGSLDGEVLNNGETVESRRMVYEVLPAGRKALLYLQGADHLTFAGIDKVIPSNFLMRREASTIASEVTHQRAVASVTTAWLKAQLLDQPMATPAGLDAGDVWLQG